MSSTKKSLSPQMWGKIKTQYMSGVSMREISRQHGIGVATVSDRAKKEGWKIQKERYDSVVEQNILEVTAEKRQTNAEMAEDIINRLLKKVSDDLAVVGVGDTKSTKDLVACMQQLSDMGAYHSETRDVQIEWLSEDMSSYAD